MSFDAVKTYWLRNPSQPEIHSSVFYRVHRIDLRVCLLTGCCISKPVLPVSRPGSEAFPCPQDPQADGAEPRGWVRCFRGRHSCVARFAPIPLPQRLMLCADPLSWNCRICTGFTGIGLRSPQWGLLSLVARSGNGRGGANPCRVTK